MNYRIDNLQYCNWSREIFEINKEAGLDAIHVTIVYHEDYDEFIQKLKNWEKLTNSTTVYQASGRRNLLFFLIKTIVLPKYHYIFVIF